MLSTGVGRNGAVGEARREVRDAFHVAMTALSVRHRSCGKSSHVATATTVKAYLAALKRYRRLLITRVD